MQAGEKLFPRKLEVGDRLKGRKDEKDRFQYLTRDSSMHDSSTFLTDRLCELVDI
jgi:hypothetical protein